MIHLNKIKFFLLEQSIFEANKSFFKSNKFLPQIKQIIPLTINQWINFFDLNKYLA